MHRKLYVEAISKSLPLFRLDKELSKNLTKWRSVPGVLPIRYVAHCNATQAIRTDAFYPWVCWRTASARPSPGPVVKPSSLTISDKRYKQLMCPWSWASGQVQMPPARIHAHISSILTHDAILGLMHIVFPNMAAFHAPLLSLDDFEIINARPGRSLCIGDGVYGRVIIAKLNGHMVCIKMTSKHSSSIVDLVHEAGLNWRLRDTGAVPRTYGMVRFLFDAGSKYYEYGIVMDFIGRNDTYAITDLADLLDLDVSYRRIGKPQISDREWIRIFHVIAKKLARIHKAGLIVNDLKCNNILISFDSGRLDPFIIDMGMGAVGSRHMPISLYPGETLDQFHCSYPGIAPEIMATQEAVASSDIYAFGAILSVAMEIIPDLRCRLMCTAMHCKRINYKLRPTARDLKSELFKMYYFKI